MYDTTQEIRAYTNLNDTLRETALTFLREGYMTTDLYDSLVQEGVTDTIKTADKRASDKIDSASKGVVETIKQITVGDTQEEIINNKTKVSSVVKKAITLGTGWVIAPTITLLGAFTYAILRKKLKKEEKQKILADLKLELELCETKIQDAESAGEKEKKYQLIRLRNELKRSIHKIQVSK